MFVQASNELLHIRFFPAGFAIFQVDKFLGRMLTQKRSPGFAERAFVIPPSYYLQSLSVLCSILGHMTEMGFCASVLFEKVIIIK